MFTTKPNPSLVIITGLSGAGKSSAMRVFEDLGYYCIDNLPPALILNFYTLYKKGTNANRGVVIASDVRSGALFDDFDKSVANLKKMGIPVEIFYLDCSPEILVNRFKEVRRSHPLEPEFSIKDAIIKEKQLLTPVKNLASKVIDTSAMSSVEFRKKLLSSLLGLDEQQVTKLKFTSFGFKFGTPVDADFIFDVRFLPNPFYIKELKSLTGEDDKVFDYVMNSGQAEEFFKKIVELLNLTFDSFIDVGKFSITVAFGCTGGKHRSVAFARKLTEYYSSLGRPATRSHRDIGNPL
ncbi:MAG: RNase adapter RapZ [Deltaproteobacteria bacterium]|nr:RNase adapter RapZ [Deltaproteobacteria bacterium]